MKSLNKMDLDGVKSVWDVVFLFVYNDRFDDVCMSSIVIVFCFLV